MGALDVFALFLGLSVAILILLIGVASAAATHQERKIWAPRGLPSLTPVGLLKVFLFNVFWMTLCGLSALFLAAKRLAHGKSVQYGRGRPDGSVRDDDGGELEAITAKLTCSAWVGRTVVRGAENLPEDARAVPAPVFVANHASQIDPGVVYYLNRRFKWVAKDSVMFIPGVGQLMWMSNHIFIHRREKPGTKQAGVPGATAVAAAGRQNRDDGAASSYVSSADSTSARNIFAQSGAAVQSGTPVFYFPQGTRRIADPALPFKDGAFIVAQNSKSTLIPVSIDIPRDAWNSLYPLSLLWSDYRPTVTLTVHKPVEVTGKEDREALKKHCFDTIYSMIPRVGESDKIE